MNRKVKVYRTTEEITVCGMGHDNPNPVFEFIGSNIETRLTYPYPIHNYHLRDRRDKGIELVVIENEFLKVSFSADFGGRIWSAVDKKSGEEMFFHNNSFKSYYAGCGGAYIGAGVELDYPNAHSITNCMPRKVAAVQNEDGSATVTISEWERVYRTQWQISFTLVPGEARLLQHVCFYNRSHLPGRYRYWCNASCPLTDKFKFIFPEKMGSEHGGATVFTWPEYLGNDWSYYKNDHEVLGLYYLEAKDDFYGYYDSGRNFGVVHHGDRHNVPGKKLWTWGQTEIQEQRKDFLSEGLGYFGEFQSGRPVNQEHFEFIMPQEIVHWDQVWYPVKETGDFIGATDKFAVAFEKEKKGRAVLRIFANSPVKGVEAQVVVKGKTIAAIPVNLRTQQLLRESINLKNASINDCLIKFVDANGAVFEDASLKGRGEYKRRSEIREEPVSDNRSSSALQVNGAFKDMLGFTDEAEELYKEAIGVDPCNSESARDLGAMYLSRGKLCEAIEMLSRALEYNKWDGLAGYYLGYANFLAGDIDIAYDYAALSAGMYREKVNGEVLAAEAMGKKGLFEKAIKHLERASENAQLQVKIIAMKAAFLRTLGRKKDAREVIGKAKDVKIEEILIHFEDFFLDGSKTESGRIKLADSVFKDPYRFIEAALDYISMGLYDDAEKVCTIAIRLGTYLWREPVQMNAKYFLPKFRKKYINPVLFLVRGFANQCIGRTKQARDDYGKADTACYYVFCNQPEVEQILTEAIGSISSKGSLYYYLGTHLISKKRYDAALANLLKAEKAGLVFDVLYRNIAAIYWKQKDKHALAEKYYKKAVDAGGDDFNNYVELAELYQLRGAGKKRLELILSIPQKYIRGCPDIALLALMVLAENGDVKSYEKLAKKIDLSGWEGEGRNVYLRSRIVLGKTLFDKRLFAESLRQFDLATEYPDNFGTSAIWAEDYPLVQLNYLKAVSLKKVGHQQQAEMLFRQVVNEDYKIYYFEGTRNGVNKVRFYQALAFKELGCEADVNRVLDGVNYYRQSRGLIPLKPDLKDEKLWDAADPEASGVSKIQGPEV